MLRLLTYNIRKGGRGREMAIAEVIRGWAPDLVLLQEATDTRVVESVAEMSGLPHFKSRRGFSTAFLAAEAPLTSQWLDLPDVRRAVLEIALPGLTVYNVHLRAVHSNWTERGRKRELRALLSEIDARAEQPHIIAGDLNTLAPDENLDLRKLPPRLRLVNWLTGGKVRYETIQIMLDAGYIDLYRSLHYDPGFTFPTWDPHVRLDFIFATNEIAERIEECIVLTELPAPSASDHFPLTGVFGN